jgi:hypothetical protein
VRRLSLLPLCLFAVVGCGGSGSNSSTAPRTFAGEYTATWVNVADAEDHGVSTWTVGQNGQISGNDLDVSGEFSYIVFGEIDAAGNMEGNTSRVGAEEVIRLSGRLQFDNQNQLVGNLVWDSVPPLTYRYTFTRQEN